MRVTVITPTADRQVGIDLCELWMARQTIQPDQWIVADDGIVPAYLRAGQTHIRRERTQEGGGSLAMNMLAALEHATGDVILVFEDDDHYAPDHIETCLREIQGFSATGSIWQRYYNIEKRCWKLMRNIGSALCNTAFMADKIPFMRSACERAIEKGSFGVDRLLWDSLAPHEKNITDTETVVGIKGLPGRKGLGMGHRPDNTWHRDPDLSKLKEWVGEDAALYV